jgi:hypothetical protein
MINLRLLAAMMLPVVLAGAAFAQNATLNGKIVDQESGEELLGANVLLVGTTLGAASDLDGKYALRNIPPGRYDIRFSYVGYTTKLVAGVDLAPGQSLKMDLALSAESFKQDEIVVTAERVLATESALLAERRKSSTIGDGISAEQIKKTPDATSGDALRRVTGLTIVDNKFVYVRGVTDRYNGTSLNGVTVTSTDTDVDRKSFAFDMIPSNLLENSVVVKTATPDMPGDFSGGFVRVNTLDFPSRRIVRMGFMTSYNSITSTQDFAASQGGAKDWLGFDDGTRAYPEGVTEPQKLAQALPNTWGARSERAPFNGSFNLAMGDRLPVGEDELGFVGALSYSNTFNTTAFSEAPTYVYGGMPVFRFEGKRYEYNVLWAGLLDLNYKLSGEHKISFRNSYNQSAEDKISQSTGANVAGSEARRQSTEWDQRSLYLGQLGGEHIFSMFGDLEAQWKLYVSSSRAQEPDRKQVEYTRGASDEESLGENYRTWSKLIERSRGMNLDLSQHLGPAKLKLGAVVEMRDRSFDIQAYSTIPGRDPRYFSLLLLPLETIFSAENFEPGKFSFISSSAFTGAYSGVQRLNAYYLMGDLPFVVLENHFQITGGVRIENSEINVSSPQAFDDPTIINAHLQKTDILPSINLKYMFSEAVNLRLAHYQSVNRPEFRELANVLYLDYDQDQNVIGNPYLDRAYVHNYDIRLEVFPGAGEVVAVSYFTKSFHNAIEERLQAAPDRYVKTWFNSPGGTNSGWEFEVRTTLAYLGDALSNLSLNGNYTIISSEVEYAETRTDMNGLPLVSLATRPMQGQSPWTWNLSLQYTVPEWGTSFGVFYNKFGRRLNAVGDVRDYDVYEEARDMIDLSLTQQLFAGLEAKFGVRNLAGKERVLTSGDQRVPYSTWSLGTVYSFSVSVNL